MYIQDVMYELKDGFEWSDLNTFEENGWKYLGATLGGALGGLGAGIGTTMLAGGLGNVVSGLFSGEINSLSSASLHFGMGMVTSGLSYGLSKCITSSLASKKISSILGTSNKNIRINSNLRKANFGDLKIGRDGFRYVTRELYIRLGYDSMQQNIAYGIDFTFGLIS